MNKRFKKGDKVWVKRSWSWEKGRICENMLEDGTYLVKMCGFLEDNFVYRKLPGELERRTGIWR